MKKEKDKIGGYEEINKGSQGEKRESGRKMRHRREMEKMRGKGNFHQEQS